MAAPTSHTITEHVIDNAKYIVSSCLTTLAQMSLGQIFLRAVDRGFWVIEKSAQWSLPCHEAQAEENGKSFQSMELVRPLPWVFFLPSLILLRLCRFGWNVGSTILGYPMIEPSDIVKYVQKTRRRLRTIKSNGIKTLRQRRSGSQRPLSLTPDEKSTTESAIGTFRTVDQKRKYIQLSSDDQESDESADETLSNKIDRLVREGSYNDRDFEPGVSSDDEASNPSDSEDEDLDVSQNEVQALLDENKDFICEQKRLRNMTVTINSSNDIETKMNK